MFAGPKERTQRRGAVAVGLTVAALACWGVAVVAVPPTAAELERHTCSDASCHGPLLKAKVVHAPLASDACDACHEAESGEGHTFSFTEDGNALCTECHAEFEGKHKHEPLVSGECITCHNPHSSDAQGLLTSDSVGELCKECHAEVTEDLEFLHGPVASGDCTTCHNPHAADHDALLSESGKAVCFECHDDIEAFLDEATSKHQPVEEGCTACHSPHGARNKMMLLQRTPDLCTDCHDAIADEAADASVAHTPVATGDACANCHLPHGSTHAALLRDSQSGTCLSCHSEEIKTQSRILTNIGELLKTKQHLHGPVQDGECSTCHAPHGGQRRSLLAGAFPERFYSPFEEDRYALCFSCHDVEAFEEPEVEDETQFRNEKQNLHYVHVNKPKKGRSCGVCHVVHASNGRGHVAESTVFGTWRLPIGFTPTETGGACQPGCHRPYGYDRESPVTNLRKAQPIQPD